MSKKRLIGMEWLRARMEEIGYASLQQVADDMCINRGNLWRYFSLHTRPSIEMLPIFCDVLQASSDEILQALDVIKPTKSLAA
ncbi:HTH_XRE domain containing protein [uncultured Caudovirales phage]|uniref:HTH_XRE domain containing protein n=1 Tax=uncultured Caudovirales phage TaxID=2100421 RepID=A0A6J5RC80_9CAUD|nr:HTH_XRE domain containing protein [uncultured Caudovirales phage]